MPFPVALEVALQLRISIAPKAVERLSDGEEATHGAKTAPMPTVTIRRLPSIVAGFTNITGGIEGGNWGVATAAPVSVVLWSLGTLSWFVAPVDSVTCAADVGSIVAALEKRSRGKSDKCLPRHCMCGHIP